MNRVSHPTIALFVVAVLAMLLQACGDAVVTTTPGVLDSGDPSRSSGNVPPEPTPAAFAPSGPLPTIDPAVMGASALTCGIDKTSFPPQALAGPGA